MKEANEVSITVEPRRLIGLPLVTKATAENDYTVTCDGLRVGRIMLQPIANGGSVWLWTITGAAMVQAGLSSSGKADSLEEARQAFRAQPPNWRLRGRWRQMLPSDGMDNPARR